jgi:DNA polymerase-3 subunit alpha
MAFFAGYGFNKSHSAAYALVAYHTGWLKAHHPVHFMAALLTTEKGHTDKLVKYINECRGMGIEVLPPDVNSSGLDFTAHGDKVRFGLSAIKNVGEGAIRSILDARRQQDRFRSLHELCAAVDLRLVNKRVLEALVQSGALDSLGPRRSQLAAVVDSALEFGQKLRADREAGQARLFGGDSAEDDGVPAHKLPDLPDWDEKTRLSHEKATLGFYVSGHPLEDYRDLLEEFTTHRSSGLAEGANGSEVVLGGIVTDLNRRKSKKGEWWASLQLEDLDGQVDVLVFPKTYATFQTELDDDRSVMVTGRLQIEDERVRVIADSIAPLGALREQRVEAVQLRLDAGALDQNLVDAIRRAVDAHRGSARLFFEVARPGSYRLTARAETAIGVTPSREFSRALETLVGPDRLRYRGKS